MISPTRIEKIRLAASCPDLIGQEVELKQKGKRFWGLSPFKAEKTPSFSVEEHRWRCFSTNQGGDIFKYFQAKEGMNFPEAVKHVAGLVNIEVEESEADRARNSQAASLRSIHQAATDFYTAQSGGMEFFAERQITNQAVHQGYFLGSAPDEWSALYSHLNARHFSDELIESAGLCYKGKSGRYIDRFRARSIFPITDPYGRVIAFGGRKDDDDDRQQGKYINSPESEIYRKAATLYGLSQAKDNIRQTGFAYLVEGYTDVLMIAQKAECNAVASCGTAFTEQQAKLLARYTSKVVIAYDGDEAGIKATKAAIQLLLAQDFSVEVMSFPRKEDPDSFLLKHGRKGWDELPRKNWLTWWLDSEKQPENPTETANLYKDLLQVLENVQYEVERHLYIKNLGESLGVKPEMLAGAEIPSVPAPALSFDPTQRDQQLVERLEKHFKITVHEDFVYRNGQVIVRYKDLKGKELNEKRHGLAGAKPPLTQHVQQVYIPRGIRGISAREEKPLMPLLLVQDAVTAEWLSDIGIPAVGLSWRYGFLRKQGGKSICQTLKQVVGLGFTDVVMVAQGEAFSPYPLKGNPRPQDNPYASLDAASISKDWVDLMVRVKEAFPDQRTHLMYQVQEDTPVKTNFWFDQLAEDTVGMFPQYRKELAKDLQAEVVAAIRGSGEFLQALCLSDYSRKDYEKLLRLDSPQRFFEFHGGFERLGSRFQFGQLVYDVDRDGQVSVTEEAQDELPILEMGGQYWSRRRDGLKKISNFKLYPILKIRGQKPYVLTQLEDRYKARHDLVLDPQLLLQADQFHLRVYGLADCFFHGSNQELRHLQEMVFQRIPSAYLMDQLGHQKVKIEDRHVEVYAFGNGLLTYDQGYLPADDKGLVRTGGQTFFLPAEAEYEISADRDAEYETHRKFAYIPGNTTFEEWINLMFQVHTEAGAHVGFSYALMSMFRDLIYENVGKIPNCYLQGETGSGKSTLRESLSYLWGEVPTLMINGNPSPAAIGSLPMQAHNAPVVMEEFNVFKMVQNRREDIIDVAKAVYDGRSRAVRQNAQTDFLKNKPVKATLLCCGQEGFYTYDEAVPNRFIVAEFLKRPFDKKSYNDLRLMEQGGIGHLLEELLMHRPLIQEHFHAARVWLEDTLGDAVKDVEVLDRLVQNWAITIAPLLILIRRKKIQYPWTMEQILQHAVASIKDHASKSIKLGIVGEFWAFVQAEFGQSLDDRIVFYYKEKDELRIRYRDVYRRFIKYLSTNGDKTIQAPTEQNLLGKLTDKGLTPAYLGTTTTYMGFVRDAEGKIVFKRKSDTEHLVPEYDKKRCLRFDMSQLDIEISTVEYAQFMPTTEDSNPPVNGQTPAVAHAVTIPDVQQEMPF